MNDALKRGDLVSIGSDGYVVPCKNKDAVIGTVVDVLDGGRVNILIGGKTSIAIYDRIVTVPTIKRENKVLDIETNKFEETNNSNKTIIKRRLDAI